MKKSSFIKFFSLGLVVVLIGLGIFFFTRPREDLKTVRSESELYSFYTGKTTSCSTRNIAFQFLLPFVTFPKTNCQVNDYYPTSTRRKTTGTSPADLVMEGISATGLEEDNLSSGRSSSNEYSTTNIQVENVDEADIIKTDGEYIYSISDDNVIISDVRSSAAPTVASYIEPTDNSIPEDLILSGDTLTIIGTENTSGARRTTYYYSRTTNTTVRIYDIKDRKNPRLEKNYSLPEPYYTSRRIDDKLYVISSGPLRKKTNEELVDRTYSEDHAEKEFPIDSIHYLQDVSPSNLTLISVVDLNNLNENITLEPFLIDISNAYVSENAFYLLDEKYTSDQNYNTWDMLKSIFGLKGIFGIADLSNSNSYSREYKTEIYKFDIEKSGNISFSTKTKTPGSVINQYSLDENAGHLRIALEAKNESYVAIFDEKLNKLGESPRFGKGEKMYASRFIGDKAYLVTYKNTDPLFVIDLANESNPKILGELKIPGYSVYLHPYDENHLIGIGIDTEEEVSKDVNGRVLSSFAYITGMKLALFDISDFKNPKEISKLHIGDSRTSSAILTNPKALLFSKEKQLLGIPVNNYASDFKIRVYNSEIDDISELTDTFRNNQYERVSEGYLVYNINLEQGISEKGEIIHENSELVRGAYINDDLITVSSNLLKINNLKDLELKSQLNLTKEK